MAAEANDRQVARGWRLRETKQPPSPHSEQPRPRLYKRPTRSCSSDRGLSSLARNCSVIRGSGQVQTDAMGATHLSLWQRKELANTLRMGHIASLFAAYYVFPASVLQNAGMMQFGCPDTNCPVISQLSLNERHPCRFARHCTPRRSATCYYLVSGSASPHLISATTSAVWGV